METSAQLINLILQLNTFSEDSEFLIDFITKQLRLSPFSTLLFQNKQETRLKIPKHKQTFHRLNHKSSKIFPAFPLKLPRIFLHNLTFPHRNQPSTLAEQGKKSFSVLQCSFCLSFPSTHKNIYIKISFLGGSMEFFAFLSLLEPW